MSTTLINLLALWQRVWTDLEGIIENGFGRGLAETRATVREATDQLAIKIGNWMIDTRNHLNIGLDEVDERFDALEEHISVLERRMYKTLASVEAERKNTYAKATNRVIIAALQVSTLFV